MLSMNQISGAMTLVEKVNTIETNCVTKDKLNFTGETASELIIGVDGSSITSGSKYLKVSVNDDSYAIPIGDSSLSDKVNTLEQNVNSLNLTGNSISLTGFTSGDSTEDIAATDNVAVALGKLQNRISELERTAIVANEDT